jgi:lipid-A-disaccharide synthase
MRVFISAAEPSGDRIGAALMKEWKKSMDVSFVGVSGPLMREVGMESVAQMKDFMAMGIIDVLKRLPQILKAKDKAMKALKQMDRCICIDAPDFHLPILRHAKKQKILSIGIVSPQIWAWRPKRVNTIAQQMDRLLCLFNFEPELYPEFFDARFVGHPIRDWTKKRTQFRPNHFALFPGSRPQEIKRHLPTFIETAQTIKATRPNASFVISTPKGLTIKDIPPFIAVCHSGAEAARDAQAALTKSGTISLELACMGTPMVVAHRVNPLTYFLGKYLVKGIKHISLPNILSKSPVVPEYVQFFDANRLCNAIINLPNEQNIDLEAIGNKNAIQQMLQSII